MGLIILPGRQTHQPASVQKIGSIALTRGLVGAWLPTCGPRNLVGISGTFAPSSRLFSRGGVGGVYVGKVSDEARALSNASWSFVTAFVNGMTVGGTRCVFGCGPTASSDNNKIFGMHAVHTNATYSGAVYTGTGYSVIGKPTGGALVDGVRYVIAAGVSGGVGEVYNNGQLTATASGLSSPMLTGTELHFGRTSASTDNLTPGPAIEFFFLWNRKLSAGEFREASLRPYSIFPARRRLHSVGAAAAFHARPYYDMTTHHGISGAGV